MSLLFLVFLVLSPLSPAIFNKLDLWYAAGHYFQVGIAILLSYSFFVKQKAVKITNLPLALLTLCVLGNSLWYWYAGVVQQKHNFIVVLPAINYICFLIFYRLSLQLERKDIYNILSWLSYSLCGYLFLCTLQYLDLFPYFEVFAYADGAAIHRLVGFMGNESQNGMYLALILPIFFLNQTLFGTLCALFTVVLVGLSGSATGIVVVIAVIVFFSLFHRLSKLFYITLSLMITGFIVWKAPMLSTYINPHSRLELWTKLWSVIKENPLFGYGLGTMNLLAKKQEFWGWRHAHNEFLHYWFCIGLVGVISILYCIYEYFRIMLKDRLSIVLASCFLGFCVASLNYFPSHLWLPSTIGMTAYSFSYALRNGEKQ